MELHVLVFVIEWLQNIYPGPVRWGGGAQGAAAQGLGTKGTQFQM